MSEMVERVAMAISGAPFVSQNSRRKARAAIEAMRKPTENMLFVGSNEDAGYSASDLRISWQLMIDEALK